MEATLNFILLHPPEPHASLRARCFITGTAVQVAKIREVVEKEFPGIDGGPSNARLLEPAGIVSWGGFSLTLVCTFGMAVALQWDNGWDYFINISSADHPVLTQVGEKIQAK